MWTTENTEKAMLQQVHHIVCSFKNHDESLANLAIYLEESFKTYLGAGGRLFEL